MFKDFLNRFRTPPAEASESASGAAAAEQREIFGPSIQITAEKKLTLVHTWTPIEKVRNSQGQLYCLDMEEAGIDEAVNWIRAARRTEPFETRRMPIVYLIGPPRSLSTREWHAINNELKPAGGYFYKRRDYNATFQATMQTLCDELARQYRSSARRITPHRAERESDSLVTR